jgi:hypothetical protein
VGQFVMMWSDSCCMNAIPAYWPRGTLEKPKRRAFGPQTFIENARMAERIFREQCVGVAWELASAQLYGRGG